MTAAQPTSPTPPSGPVSASDTAAAARPEPVLSRAGIASGVTGLAGLVLTLLVVFHVITPAGSAILGPAIASAVPAVIGAAGGLLAAWKDRKHTLPLDDPRVAEAWAQIMAAERSMSEAIGQVRRPPGPQTPGVADHAAPDA